MICGEILFKRGGLECVAVRVHVLGQSAAKLHICSWLKRLVLGWNFNNLQLKVSPN